ncbi:S41 family peptidase [Candidatus Peregrinibacteria bacterium]|nr:S41 family peptidase [Candidatus Peregrinibacteria bacterium]
MRTASRLLLFVFATVVVLTPVGAAAKDISALLPTGDESVVSRGDFLRAAIEALDLGKSSYNSTSELPYRRIPKAMEKYVRIAEGKKALDVFKFDLLLARGITRGEALQVLVKLTGSQSSRSVSFSDVTPGSAEELAVKVAVEKGWMEPLKPDLFGVRRVLTSKETLLLLRKVSGQRTEREGATVNESTPTIKIDFKSSQRIGNLPKTQILEAIWKIIQEDFLHQDKVNPDEAAWKAAEGLVQSLGDKYSTFMKPANAQNFQSQIQGEVSGIGAQVEFVNEILTIVTPIVGSPAEAAGLLPGDQIIKVDGTPLAGLDFGEAVDKVRGPRGSTATLTIRRNGTELTVKVTRDVVKVPEDIITWQGDVLIVKIAQFGKITESELRPILAQANAKKPKGIVLDLRNNPGGLLDAATIVMSAFVPKGSDVAVIRANKSERKETTAFEPVIDPGVKMVTIVNEGSASASEIVAGALQDHKRSTVIGSKSFGKGTVQQVVQFVDQSNLKLTIAEWLTPQKRKIDGAGIMPDIAVKEEEGRDAPLLKALELLR